MSTGLSHPSRFCAQLGIRHLNPKGFIAWLNRLGIESHLLNTTSLVQWNFDKRYLVELREKGKNVVPTAIVTSVSEVGHLAGAPADTCG